MFRKDTESLIAALQYKVNSALLTFENHTNDNSFLDSDINYMINGLKKSDYVPAGICTSIPYIPSNYEEGWYIGFVFYYKDEVQWIHMPKVTLFALLEDYYGREKAEEIYDNLEVY